MLVEQVQWLTGPSAPGYATQPWLVGTELAIPFDVAVPSNAEAGLVDEFANTYTRFAFGVTDRAGNVKLCDNVMGENATQFTALPVTLNFAAMLRLFGITDHNLVAARLNTNTQPIARYRATSENTILPTSAIAVEMAPRRGLTTKIVSYATVVGVDGQGRWRTASAGYAIAPEATGAPEAWSRPRRMTWLNTDDYTDPWQQIAFARARPSDRYLYVFGTPNGRFGAAKVARVEQARVLDVSAYPSPYRYWDGSGWSPDRSRAIDVIPAPVGELSVFYHRASAQWIAGYFDETAGSLIIRTAKSPEGPWSAPNVAARLADYPGSYGCFFLQKSTNMASPLFTMSRSGAGLRHVRLMRLKL